MDAFAQLSRLKGEGLVPLEQDGGSLAVCPDMGARVFARLGGLSLHRIDLEVVADPSRPFNNFGGANLWPAPEGGKFGFNYRGNDWYVPPAINSEPFQIASRSVEAVKLKKTTELTNRAGTTLQVHITREVGFVPVPLILQEATPQRWLAFQTVDRFQVLNEAGTDQALLAAWTLDQFQATDQTISFCAVRNPREAINFDFYAPPGDRTVVHEKGFTYATDGLRKGQIGIRKAANPSLIGFFDRSRHLLALKINRTVSDGLLFNIADNEQPEGPYSAADSYSIFNSDPDMRAFELETIGPLQLRNGKLESSEVISLNAFALFDDVADIDRFLAVNLGPLNESQPNL
jgi:hypothetical protein